MSQQINLYRARFQPVDDPLRAWRLIAIVMGAMILLAGSFGWNAWRIDRLQADSRSTREALSRTQAALGELSKAAATHRGDPELHRAVTRAEALQRARAELTALLDSGVLGSSDGFSESLRALARQHESGLKLSAFTLAGGRLELKGQAQSAELVPAYLQRLRTEKSLSGLTFGRLRISAPETATPPAAGPRAAAAVEFVIAGDSPASSTTVPPR